MNNNVIIFDGFDHVGKNYLMSKMFPNYEVYRPNYELFDKFQPRNTAWVLGFSIMDFLNSISSINMNNSIIIDRCITSSIVYDKLYHNGSSFAKNQESYSELINYYKSNELFNNSTHVYVTHYDKDSASKIYDIAMSSKKLESLDRFNNFDSYWDIYNKADNLFKLSYDELDIEPIIINNRI